MNKQILFLLIAACFAGQHIAWAQSSAPAGARPATAVTPTQAQRPGSFDLAEYGVRFEADPRLLVMMAALDTAGLDTTPAGAPVSAFRVMVRRDLAQLSPDLRSRLQTFYQRNRLPAPATPAQQAARYVSLALALGAAPSFEAPARTEDLPGGLLEVLDFAPLLREFYRQSGIEARLPDYIRASLAEGDRLRRPTAEMMRTVLSYLHTRPLLSIVERVPTPAPSGDKKKTPEKRITLTREKERRFLIVPDLLAAPGTINFRIIGDDYYAIVPEGLDPAVSELRRAYLQYVVDPLVLRFNRDIAARRADLKSLLDARRTTAQADVTPDVFLAVARSLVVAADVRIGTQGRLNALAQEADARLKSVKTETERAALTKELQSRRQTIEDTATAQLAEAYERGAVLAFFFAEQLSSGLESAGFDIAGFFPDMIASFKVEREAGRPSQYAAAIARFTAARERNDVEARARAEAGNASTPESTADAERRTALNQGLRQVNELLRLKNFEEAESRLRELMQQYQGEPRIFFALGQAASLSASTAFDERLQAERLTRALSHYRMAVSSASPESDRALLSRAHAAMGRILAFLERPEEAVKEFDAAIQLGNVEGGAYQEAQAEKQKLQP